MATANSAQHRKGESGFNTPLVVLGALAVIFLVYAFALFMQGGFLKVQEMEKAYKIADAPADETVQDAVAEQRAKLDAGYRWVNQEQGTVGLPLEDAKDQLVRKLRTQQVTEGMEEQAGSQ